MKSKPGALLEECRTRDDQSQRFKGRLIGSFKIPYSPGRTYLLAIAHDGNEMDYLNDGISGPRWEHVSVSVEGHRRLPTWDEMNYVKDLFWLPEETVLQFHPRKSEYVNENLMVLHLWRMVGVDHPLPTKCLV